MANNTSKITEAIGLDIGGNSIKIVALQKKGGINTLTAYNIKKIPTNVQDSEIKNVVKEAFDEVDLHPTEINLSVSGPDVIVRFISFPKMTKDQLAEALGYEAEKYIPFSINEVFLDFLILGDAPADGQMNVLLAVAKRELIEARVKMVQQIGLNINVVDIAPFAMFNALVETGIALDEKKVYAFLGIGHVQTDILISVGARPCFMRQVQIGGKSIIESLSYKMGVSLEKAEEYILDIDKEKEEETLGFFDKVLGNIAKEIQLSFGYFENRYNKRVDSVYCCGGMTDRKEALGFLKQKLDVDIKQWNSFQKIKISDNLSKKDVDSVASQLAVAVGLALRG